ncbi:MAG: hypothetical protein JO341_11495 [Gammaproteobacteria bacterium]|nr:hypothetical protein [Gammaproteobacteria bacterium]MBV9621631.1 hypothetical protein [Gammaproteobacteria bacterium]
MKALPALILIALAGCATGAPPVDNPSAPPPVRTDATRENEVRALDQAEAQCAAHGQHAEAKRVDGTTLYDCVAPEETAPVH